MTREREGGDGAATASVNASGSVPALSRPGEPGRGRCGPARTCIYCGALTFKGVAARAATLATLASHACASGKSPLLLQPPPR
jgi:hypothetical protein